MTRHRLLSIDGGGIRGLVPALVLQHICKETKKPIHELFDGLAGTSTGAVLALALARPGVGVDGPTELAELYRSKAGQIFKENLADRIGALPRPVREWLDMPGGFDLNDLAEPRYAADGRQRVFEDLFGETRLEQALLPLFVPAYDTEHRCPVFFVSSADLNADDPYYDATTHASMLDAAMGSSAAPTYFPPHRMARAAGGHYTLVDGGVFANNPCGLAHSFLRAGQESERDVVLSLGTGSMQHRYEYDTIRKWGLVSWATPIIKMTLDGQSEAVGIALGKRLSGRYLRLQDMLDEAGVSDDLDDCSLKNLKALEQLASKMIEQNRGRLDELSLRLLSRQ